MLKNWKAIAGALFVAAAVFGMNMHSTVPEGTTIAPMKMGLD